MSKACRAYAVSVTPDQIQMPVYQWTSEHFVRLGQREGGAAWIINAMEYEMRVIGVDDKNIVIMGFRLYFAYMLTWLMRNPSWLAAFREETAAAFRGAELVDAALIQDAARCPRVNADPTSWRLARWLHLGGGAKAGDDSSSNVAPGVGALGVTTNRLSASPAGRPFGGGKFE
ncbi:cytochrome P450 [Apiospora kogelbergensis]|uniref:Cytochrome P450 n=1 Tax=Apiospora kogelbergensis TaxID=1337665 RepID=A0AAW0QLN2_9PEZI